MGLIVDGPVLSWDKGKNFAGHIKDHGITQLLNVWKTSKNRRSLPFRWGEEIECMVIAFNDQERNAKLALCQEELLPRLKKYVSEHGGQSRTMPSFQSEYGRYMIESTPGIPYGNSISDLLIVESNMRQRLALRSFLLVNKPTHVPMTLTVYPRVGVPDVFTEPHRVRTTEDTSMFLPEEAVTSTDPKYTTIAQGIDSRRGHKPIINLPVFRDTNTPQPFRDPTVPPECTVLLDHILLDAVSFGPGCCCLQVTMQAADIDQARILYDSLIPIAPIMLALTAASPAYKGFLSDVDCRWELLSKCVDDRTKEEQKTHRIPDSRWSYVRWYLTEEGKKYSDIELVYDEPAYERLTEAGMDDILAKHFANLYIRDPLVVYPNRLEQNDEQSNEHFESIQSSVWQTLRFKPPQPNCDMGWRVEFRSMEVQLSDFENTAFAIFMVLLSRALLKFGGNGAAWGLPISMVEENMKRAQERDAARSQRFLFNTSATPELGRDTYGEMTMNEIINGKGDEFEGLMGLIRRYLNSLDAENEVGERSEVEVYLDLISKRAEGSLKTTATWIRDFVRSHPRYRHDSVIGREVNYDLLKAVNAIEKGERDSDGLLPSSYLSRRASIAR
ncbi:hypothetical protein M407DRAFT_222350 [Tulasnella calospora MUT 4182]|uniref:Glutamate--cysteine ligase n=1 Tax=Tulasnella calospora MUT 4182 TaxID=1051891 RepID=A0A0C3PXA2_9AGAM|nr:hypothetical protein M407DRAFT_222350 [Tulasnella calospora MUT 4182]